MSVAEKYRPFPLFPSPSKKPHHLSKPFDETLISRLRSLLPLPDSPLSFLALAADLLSATLSSAAILLSDPSLAASDRQALSSHLDSSAALLDALNAVSSDLDRLSRLRLHLRFALHLLSSPPSPDSLRRARRELAEWNRSPIRAVVLRLDPPRGKISAVRRAIFAVEAVSNLVVRSLVAVLGDGEKKADLAGIRISGDFPWADAFNAVVAAVSEKIGASSATEIEAVEGSLRRLTAVIDAGEDLDGDMTARLRSAVEDAEKATGELTDGLDRLSNAVDGVFRAALAARNAALQSFRIGPKKCK